jgi:hypothetical protein
MECYQEAKGGFLMDIQRLEDTCSCNDPCKLNVLVENNHKNESLKHDKLTVLGVFVSHSSGRATFVLKGP